MKKKIILTIVFIITMLILLSGIVSALEWDNIKRYDEKTKTITIVNALGLGEDLEKATLLSNTYNCGEYCEANKEITLYKKGVLIQDLEFYRLFTDGSRELGSPIEYSLKYYTNIGKSYYINGETLKNGTTIQKLVIDYTQDNYAWRDYELGTELEAGTYQVKLEGRKKVNKIYDWIITIQGRELTEWATWGNISLGDDAEVLLKAPDDNFRITTLGDVVSFNATANITGGSALTNMSLYSDHGGTWGLNETVTFNASVTGDVGEPATDRGAIYGPDLTLLHLGNPASTDFTCTEVKIWLVGTAINITVGSFNGSGDTWQSRDYAYLGALSTGSLVTVSDLSIEFINGDVIGMYDSVGGANIEADTSGGSDVRYKSGSKFGLGAESGYTQLADDLLSLNCTGIGQTTTFSAQNYSKSVTQETLWNVQACDTDSACGFATSNRTVLLPLNAPNITATAPSNAYNTSSTEITFNVTANDDINLVNISLYIDGTINETNSSPINNTLTSFTINVGDGDHTWSALAWDNDSQSDNSTIFTFTVDTTAPTISITSPNETFNFQKINTNLSVNWTVADTRLDTCIFEYEGTNTTVTCLDNNTNINITNSINKSLIFYVNDTLGNVNSSSVTWNYRLFLNNQSHTSSILEGADSTFTLNMTTNGTDITIGNLSHNGTENIATITQNGDNFYMSRIITAPSTSEDVNLSFFWNITQRDGVYYALDSQNQTINNLGIDNCSTNSNVLYNFTIKNEETQSNLIGGSSNNSHNTTGKVNLQIYSKDRGTLVQEFNSSYNRTNPFSICLNNAFGSGEKYVVDAEILYDADGFAQEFYHIQNNSLNSSGLNINISLFDLDDDDSQIFKLTYKDEAFLPVDKALIQIQRKYVDEGVFKNVEIPITDVDGETIGHLVLNDVIYTFIVVKHGEILGVFSNKIAECQNPTLITCEINLNSFSSTISPTDFTSLGDFSFTLTYDNDTRIVQSIFSIPSGSVSAVKLNVTKYDQIGTTQVCADTISSSSGTLECTVPSSFGNETILAQITKDGTVIGKGFIRLSKSPAEIFGGSLVFLSIFLFLTLIGTGISNNPMITGVFLILGLILSISLGLTNGGLIGTGATALWLISAVVLLLIKGARRQ